jgi:hypothetical protein
MIQIQFNHKDTKTQSFLMMKNEYAPISDEINAIAKAVAAGAL